MSMFGGVTLAGPLYDAGFGLKSQCEVSGQSPDVHMSPMLFIKLAFLSAKSPVSPRIFNLVER